MTHERHPDLEIPEAPASSPADQELELALDLRDTLRGFTNAQRAPRTRHEYEKYLRDFVRWARIRTRVELVGTTSDQVIEYRNALQARGLSPSTINGRLVAVRGLFGRLFKAGDIPGNPADPDLVPGLQVSDVSRTEGLSEEEVQAIIATCDGTLRGLRDRALLMTLFYEGLRRSEASKLRYRDITTKKGLLEVKGAKNNPYDTIRLRLEVRQAIENYLEVLNRDLQRLRTGPDDPVFVSLSRLRSFGKRLAPSSINEIVKLRVKEAKIGRRVTAHSLRHTVTTLALANGVPVQQVQRHLRHKDVATTLRYDRERDVRRNPTLDALPRLE
jgi:site-specific recombinase XerD